MNANWYKKDRRADRYSRASGSVARRMQIVLLPKEYCWEYLSYFRKELEQVKVAGTCHCLGAIGRSQFGEDMFYMPFGSIEANDQTVCNLLVGEASGQEREHFLFTRA